MSRGHRNGYATALRAEVRAGQGPRELVDRLLVSALIEARSCERFALLAESCTDAPLAKLYRGLWASEHGHYLSFLQLAEGVLPPAEVRRRWQELLKAESRIVRAQPPGPRMHSGLSSTG